MPPHTDSLVAVKPAGRVGFTILFSFNAVPKERHTLRWQSLPVEAAFSDHRIRTRFKRIVVEESVWHLEKQFVAAIVADEHGNVVWIVAFEGWVLACRGFSIHGTSQKTFEQRCR